MQNNSVNDIGGYPEEKEKLLEIADSFRKYEKYKAEGLEIPHGLLLTGEPGTGKTLFACSLSKEAEVPFYTFKPNSISISLSSSRLRKLFRKAIKHSPSIIFIDEVDRYFSNGEYTSDESNKFLSTLLTFLDGTGTSCGVMTILSSCNIDDLPNELLRSGRMDLKINFKLPTRKDRVQIISLYLNKVKMKKNVNPEVLAFKTSGFSGADISNMVMMAAREAENQKKEYLTVEDFRNAIFSIQMSDIKRTNMMRDREKIAIHEVGHLLTSKLLLNTGGDIAIDSYGDNLGTTLFNDYKGSLSSLDKNEDGEEDSYQESSCEVQYEKKTDDCCSIKGEDFYLNMICVLLGGRAAEKIIYKQAFPNDCSDVDRAKDIATMLCFTGVLGFSYLNYGLDDCSPSEERKILIEREIEKLLSDGQAKAEKTIKENLPLFDKLRKCLLNKTYLPSDESDRIIKNYMHKKRRGISKEMITN